MKIRLLTTIYGLRDGKAWPPVGSIITLPDDECANMIEHGMAAKVEDSTPTIERAVVAAIPDTATLTPKVGKKRGTK